MISIIDVMNSVVVFVRPLREGEECEDEWSEMRQRFKKEGLDADTLKLEDRLLQVWRWLVDAESNLRNSRRMLDKLYEQQHEEIEEMENYVGKIKKLSEKRANDVEAECSVLKHEKTELLELLEGFGALGDSIYEKVLYLGEEKVKAVEDLEILKNMKLPSNGVNTDILTEMIKKTPTMIFPGARVEAAIAENMTVLGRTGSEGGLLVVWVTK